MATMWQRHPTNGDCGELTSDQWLQHPTNGDCGSWRLTGGGCGSWHPANRYNIRPMAHPTDGEVCILICNVCLRPFSNRQLRSCNPKTLENLELSNMSLGAALHPTHLEEPTRRSERRSKFSRKTARRSERRSKSHVCTAHQKRRSERRSK